MLSTLISTAIYCLIGWILIDRLPMRKKMTKNICFAEQKIDWKKAITTDILYINIYGRILN